MKNLFKTIIGMALCAIQLSASTYQRNDAAVTEFAMTLVNETPDGLKGLLDNYFTHYPEHKGLHEKGVNGSIMMSPIAGKTGAMDPTLTLLRMDPLKNWGISNAQYVYAKEGFLSGLSNKRANDFKVTINSLKENLATCEEMLDKKDKEIDDADMYAEELQKYLLGLNLSSLGNAITLLESLRHSIEK